ncbi:hypothetical protein GCM10010168_68980 [Actinoplanes ianthinogenes]|uniref:Uncharacterized protein n=1 Tax=Actinoplanes ianthinogenes TaxID=122358 RepID=A0ABM7M0I3_9ACTN|nr:hypothetical protein [Actinoplanes ianthinogenes]BCJ45097.1 hypothetical protein Aiant_57540 [Actinoplanes ianthinogenes]GGR40559.1 hypothetical protein GCM10010168_68980 [Actinoplanes ianthinogenes]
MFATRKTRTERTAAEAWDYLSAAMVSAGETGKEAAAKVDRKSRKVARKASKKGSYLAERAGGAADEAWLRANAAAAALAGRKPGRPWGLIAGIGLLGLAAGWAAASVARAAIERQAENEQLELAETAVVVTPTYDQK